MTDQQVPDRPEGYGLIEGQAGCDRIGGGAGSREARVHRFQAAGHERIFACTVRDSWDHPANFLVWQALAQLGSYEPRYLRLTYDAPGMLRLSKQDVQLVTIGLLKQYRLTQHRLVQVVNILTENQKPLTPNGLDKLLRNWLDSHAKMMEALKRIQAMPGLETLRGFDVQKQFEQREYLPAIIEHALGPA